MACLVHLFFLLIVGCEVVQILVAILQHHQLIINYFLDQLAVCRVQKVCFDAHLYELVAPHVVEGKGEGRRRLQTITDNTYQAIEMSGAKAGGAGAGGWGCEGIL
jgi:hypothetical protein